MSPQPPGARGPELRIGDSEREAAVGALGDHYAAGRLSKQDFDERADAAWAARTRSALWPLFADLPHPAGSQPVPPPAPPVPPHPSWGDGRQHFHHGRRAGFPILPLLVVVAVLVVLGHPFVFLLLVVWLFWARTHGAWGHGRARPPHRRR
jgi:hypothetical protein